MESVEQISAHIKELLNRMVRLDNEAKLDPINFVIEEFSEFTVEYWRYFQYEKVLPSLTEEAVDIVAASLTFLTSRDCVTIPDEMLGGRIQASAQSMLGDVDNPEWKTTMLYVLRCGAIFNKTACKLRRDKASEQELIDADIDLLAATILFLSCLGMSLDELVSRCSFKYNRALNRWNDHGEK